MSLDHISLSGETLFEIGGFSVTNTFLLSVVLAPFLFVALYAGLRSRSLIPDRVQNFFEWVLETFLDFVESITGDRKVTMEIFPVAATLFLFILVSNFVELVPALGVFSFLRSPSSDLNFTLALAIFSVVYINAMAVKHLGLLSYAKKFLDFRSPIAFFVGLLEAFSEITRTISLAVRLFGNLFAGEVLLLVMLALFPVLLPLPFLALEIIIGILQAFIFAMLVVVFYSMAVVSAEH